MRFLFLFLFVFGTLETSFAYTKSCSNSDGNITYLEDPINVSIKFKGTALPSDGWAQFSGQPTVIDNHQNRTVFVQLLRLLKDGPELGIYGWDYVICTEDK